jgi:hypothetical protein
MGEWLEGMAYVRLGTWALMIISKILIELKLA